MKSKRIYGRAYAGRDGLDNLIGQQCPICLHEFQENDIATVIRSCRHAYCSLCLETVIAGKIQEARTYPRRNVEIVCPDCRAGIVDESNYGFARVAPRGSLLQEAPPDVESQYVFAWDLGQKWYCPSAKRRGEEGAATIGFQRVLSQLKARAINNLVGFIVHTWHRQALRNDGTSFMDYWERFDFETVVRQSEEINRYMRCRNRLPPLNPWRSLQTLWKWIWENIDVLSMEEDVNNAEYVHYGNNLFQHITIRPYAELARIPNYASTDFEVFTRDVFQSLQWHQFLSTAILRMLTSNVQAGVLVPLLGELNTAMRARNLVRVREVCAELGRYTT